MMRCVERRRAPQRPGHRTTLKVPDRFLEAARALAGELGTTTNDAIVRLAEDGTAARRRRRQAQELANERRAAVARVADDAHAGHPRDPRQQRYVVISHGHDHAATHRSSSVEFRDHEVGFCVDQTGDPVATQRHNATQCCDLQAHWECRSRLGRYSRRHKEGLRAQLRSRKGGAPPMNASSSAGLVERSRVDHVDRGEPGHPRQVGQRLGGDEMVRHARADEGVDQDRVHHAARARRLHEVPQSAAGSRTPGGARPPGRHKTRPCPPGAAAGPTGARGPAGPSAHPPRQRARSAAGPPRVTPRARPTRRRAARRRPRPTPCPAPTPTRAPSGTRARR